MLLPGTRLQNRYLIVEPIGEGGMGAVYKALDERLRSTVALKQTSVATVSLRKAFEREAHLLASLKHPALPKVIDHFVEDDGQFLVMEFIPGEDLATMLRHRGAAFSYGEVVYWAKQLLDVLEYLHTQEPPILHRDIKPQNLKLTARGQIILLDFGLAKGSAGQMSRDVGSILGYTPFYAPLEQIQGTGTNPTSDLYSLAATCYHLVTNVRPSDALARATSLLSGQIDPLRPANEVEIRVPKRIAELLNQAMSLNPSERPSSAAGMLASFEKASLRADSERTGEGSALAETIKLHEDGEETRVRPKPVHKPSYIDLSPRKQAKVEPQKPDRAATTRVKILQDVPTSEVSSSLWTAVWTMVILGAGAAALVGISVPSLRSIITLIVLVGTIICWIIVIFKIFQKDGPGKGIMGLICSLFAFIWGWMNAKRLGIQNIMLLWTGLLIVYVILSALLGGFDSSYNTPTP